MTVPRKYSVQELEELIAVLRQSSDISYERLAGMMEIVQLLAHFENMTDAEIETETIKYIRALPR